MEAMEEEEALARGEGAAGPDPWKKLLEVAQRKPQCKYLSIADAFKTPTVKVWLFAVVCEIGAAVKSRGTDYTVTLRIADPSCTPGMSATFFAQYTALLPCVKSCGDFISLHDVQIMPHGQDFFVKFDKKFSSFALFQSKVSAECSPYQTSAKYHGSIYDKDLLTRMKTWLPEKPLGLKDHELQLRSLEPDSTFDLVCKVLHVSENSGEWIFYVWDGTDTPAAQIQEILDPLAVEPPPLLQGPPVPRKVLCTMPCVGTVLRISSDRFVKEAVHMQNSNCWARFWNITCKQEFGIWKGVFSPSSGIRLLSPEDSSVVDRLKMYDSRKANKVLRRPMASFPSNVTDVDPKNGGYSTLMESLTHDEVTHKVKTLVRVVAAYLFGAGSELRLLRLTLEDPTARIDAYVSKDELANFFGGVLTEEVIINKINKVLGVPEAEDSEEVAPLTRNPPWIWCHLKSYYLHKNDPWGSRRYQIYGTRIRD